jgi:predicted Ser/Thr protein kinase
MSQLQQNFIIEKTVAKGGQAVVCLSEYQGQKVALKIDHTEKGRTD